MANSKLSAVEQVEAAASTPIPDDPFDLSKLRLTQDFVETGGVKKLLTTVPVRKPAPQDFIRVHPNSSYRAAVALVEFRDERETYLVTMNIARELPASSFPRSCTRRSIGRVWCTSGPSAFPPQMAEFLSGTGRPRKQPSAPWIGAIRVRANMSLGAYEMFEAAATIPDPVWPELSFQELLRVAFRDRLVDRLDHAVIKRLRGLT